MEDEKIQPGIRKCINTKAQHDEVRRHGLTSDKTKSVEQAESDKSQRNKNS